MSNMIDLKMFWVNGFAFILAVIPNIFYIIYYYAWSYEFHANSLNDTHRKELR